MLSPKDKAAISNLQVQIAALQKEIEEINPFANLKALSNKQFGETWAENYVVSQCPKLSRVNSKGYDLVSSKLGKIEVKSSRLPCKKITFNQLHPKDCDYFMFCLFDTEDAETIIYLISSQDLTNKCSLSSQHDRGANNCFSMSYNAILEKYRIKSWEELATLV